MDNTTLLTEMKKRGIELIYGSDSKPLGWKYNSNFETGVFLARNWNQMKEITRKEYLMAGIERETVYGC